MPAAELRSRLFRTDAIKGGEAGYFAGREHLIESAVKTLTQKTLTCVIYGERGIGKTSLAWQVIGALQLEHDRFARIAAAAGVRRGDFLCVPIKNLEPPRDVRDLLVQAVAPSREPRSLSSQLPELYSDKSLRDYLGATYGLDLQDLSALLRLAVKRDLGFVQRFFTDVMSRAAEIRPQASFVFFVDEADQMKSREGFGKLLKNTNVARFVLVGIADTMAELIDEHESALRKVIGGVLEVKPLTNTAIKDIYEIAHREATRLAESRNERPVRFAEDFVDLVVENSGGFPWIAQHVGDQALARLSDKTLRPSRQVGKREPVELNASYFKQAWPSIRRAYSVLVGHDVAYEEIDASDTTRRIVQVLADSRDYMSLDQLHQACDIAFNALEIGVRRLVNARVLKERGDGTYRFWDPIVRSFAVERAQGAAE